MSNSFRRLAAGLLATALLIASMPQAGLAAGAAAMPLSSYPRPVNDNGMGIHWSPTLFAQPTEMVDRYVAEVEAMGITWVKLLQGDAPKLEHEYLIAELTKRGIMPILRVFKPTNEPYEHLAALVRLGLAAGVRYYELYNEPNLSGEAGGWAAGESVSVTRIVDLWIPAADTVKAAGGLPGLPALAPGGDYDDNLFLRQFLRELVSRGRTDLLYGAWLPLHNYFLNHPLDYPYDDVNLNSTPLTTAEIAERALTAEQVHSINEARRNSRLPRSQGGYYVGDTIYEDSNGFLKFQAYARILEEEVGFLIPIITTEGGAIIGSAEDPRYPPITEDDLVEMTVGAFRYLAEHETPYYFAFTPWLLANRAGNSICSAWEGAAWYKEDGTTLAVVPALKALHSEPAALGTAAASTPTAAATALPTATPPGAGTALPTADAQNEGTGTLRYVSITLSAPTSFAVPDGVTPADASYPRPAATADGGQPTEVLQLQAAVIASRSLEAWFLPDYGGRLIRLVELQSRRDLLSLPTGLAPATGAGGPRLEGGVAWLYPSTSMPLVDDLPWQVDESASSATSLRMTTTESRSRTRLTLDAAVGDDGSLTIAITADNSNADARLVSLGVADGAGLFDASSVGDAIVPAGGSHTWAVRRPGAAVTNTTPQAARTPLVLATPIPYSTAAAGSPTATTAGIPTATRTAVRTSAPAVGADVAWDERLDELDIVMTSEAGARWQLVAVAYEDESESGGNHHVFIEFVDQDGDPCSPGADRAWVSWTEGTQELEVKGGPGGYWSEFPMYGPLGAYTVGVGSDSEKIVGLGLPGRQHVNYRLTYQLQP